MSDVTAQAFREAACIFSAHHERGTPCGEMGCTWPTGPCLTQTPERLLREQVATLTAENKALDDDNALLTSYLNQAQQAMDAVNAPTQYLHGQRVEKVCEQLTKTFEQIATLTAERDQARAKLKAMYTARDSRGNY